MSDTLLTIVPIPKEQLDSIFDILKRHKIVNLLVKTVIEVVIDNLKVEPLYTMEQRERMCIDLKPFVCNNKNDIKQVEECVVAIQS